VANRKSKTSTRSSARRVQAKEKPARKPKPAPARKRGSADKAIASDFALRDHLLHLLRGGGAHADFEHAIAGMPSKLHGAAVAGAAHSPWQLLEHMRIAQWDILEFSRNPKHVSPKWPEGYWPPSSTPAEGEWDRSVNAFRSDLKAMETLVSAADDLFARIPGGNGQTLLREALLVADHNAYHLGQFIQLRRLLGAWQD